MSKPIHIDQIQRSSRPRSNEPTRVITVPSRRSLKIRQSPKRKKKTEPLVYKVYLSDSGSEGDRERLRRSTSEDLTVSDLDAATSDATTVGKPVPIEVKGVFKAPEKMLRKWFRDSSVSLGNRFSTKSKKEGRRAVPYRHKSFRQSPDYRELDFENGSDISGVSRRAGKESRGVYSPRREHSVSKKRDQIMIYQDIGTDTTSRSPKRDLKRGYPYSRDLYEYVDTVIKTKPTHREERDFEDQEYLESLFRRPSKWEDSSAVDRSHSSGRRQRKSITEVLARHSKRKELKKKRDTFVS